MIAAFVGNEQGNSAGVSRKMLALAVAVAAVLVAVLAIVPAQKASAANVTNPGSFEAVMTAGFLKVGSTIESSIDELDQAPTLNGSINANGDILVPKSSFNFGELEMVIPEDTVLVGGSVVGINIIPTHDVTGTLDPITGLSNLRIRLKIHAVPKSGAIGSGLTNIGNNCYIGTDAAPIDLNLSTATGSVVTTTPGLSLGGIPYDSATGIARYADKTYTAPGHTGCSGLAATQINSLLGLPSPSGSNAAEFAIQYNPAPISTATININTRPAAATNQTSANFGFTTNVPSGLTYECQLDSGAWANCDSKTASYSGLSDGNHTFRVRAMIGSTPAGNASYTWNIDTVVPVYTVTGAPTGLTSSRTANIAFTVNKTMPAGATQCVLDSVVTNNCTSPRALTGLADGSHTFIVRGTDAVGNQGQTTRNWTVDGTKPTVNITGTPANPSSTADVQFTFTAADNMTANPTTQCQVRNMRQNLPAGQIVQAWTNCTSPNPQVRATGKWRFELRSIDAAGNVSDVSSYDWDANTAEPVIDSLIGPGGPLDSNTGGTRSSDAEFEFNAETFDIEGEIIPGTTFRYECWLDGESLGACEAPMTLADLTGGTPMSEGEHTFEVKPYLVATPEVPGFRTPYTWNVDTVDPTGDFETVPDAHHNSATADFALQINGTGSDGTALCKLDNGNWSNCDSNTAHSIVVADGNHTLLLRAKDQAGNLSAPVSHSWNTDTQVPTATIHETPLLNDKSDTAKFVYNSNDNEAGVQAYCQLDADEVPCDRTSHTFTSIPDGEHTFTLRVVDAAGNEVTRSYEWRSDTTAPALDITATQPAALSNQTSAAFKLLSTDTDGSGIADVSCRIDGAAWEACENNNVWNFYTGPYSSGDHQFETKVTDVAGNSTTKSHSWTVDLEKPDVAIATDIGTTKSTSASIKFLSSESSATFECKLDAGAWGACASPKVYSGLGLGNHVFIVRSVDTAGNKSDEDSMAWTIQGADPSCADIGQEGTWPNCAPPVETCPTGKVGTPPNCYDPCPTGWTGTPPNCEKPQPTECEEGYIGTPPNCVKQDPPLIKPTDTAGTFDGKNLAIRLKCPTGFKPRCAGTALAVTSKKNGKAMSSSVKNTSLAGKWKLVTLVIKPAYRDQVLALTAEGAPRIVVKQTLRSKTKKKRVVFHTYKVRTKG